MPNDRRLYPLCSCSIGIWRTPAGTKPYLLLLQDQRRFVLLLVREHEPQARPADHALSVNSLLCSARQQASSWWRHKNPFSDHEAGQGTDTQQVLAFELEWSVVEGIDFRWPLTDDARLVLEAAVICKRLFQDVEEVCHFYQPQPRGARRARISTLQQLAAADKEQQQQQQASLQLQQHPHTAAGCSGSAVGTPRSAAAGCTQQQQQQQQGGAMSRASSWASWASWTSGGTPAVFNSADREPGAAAAAALGSSSQRSSGAFAWHQQPAPPAVAAGQDAPARTVFGFEPLQQPGQQQQQHRGSCGSPKAADGAPIAAVAAQGQGACSGRCSPGSPRTAADSQCTSVLMSLPSLSAGIAADSLAAAAVGEVAAAAAAEPAGSNAAPRALRHRLTVSVGAAAASADVADQGGSCSWHEECCSIEEDVEGPGPTCQDDINVRPGSFNFFPRQLSRLGRGSAAGCATAPCSAPNSPRVAAVGHDAAAAAAFECQQHQAEQQLQRLQQACQRLEQPSAERGRRWQQQQQQQLGSRKGVAIGRTNNSSSSKAADRLATPHDRACPLCNQPLLQPLNVLQQRFHQQQHSQQQRQGARLNSSRSGSSAAAAARSRSACSLEQLLQQSKAAAAHAQATELQQRQQQPASSSSCPELCQQQQQQQQLLSPRSLAGMAAAAVGSFAARCVGQGGSGSKDGGGSSCDAAKPAAAADGGSAAGAAGGGDGVTLSAANSGELATAVAEIVPAAAAAAASAAKACSEPAGGTSNGSLAAGSSAVAPPPAAELATGANTTDQAAASGSGSSSAQPAAPQHQQQQQQQQPRVYRCRTVVMTFRDPSLPHQLKRFVGNEVRLLKLYESGLPGWAVLLPSLGLWYRPWLRRLTWLLFVLLSVVSMAMGFYDLYKNVPYFKTAMVAAFRPAAAVFEWLEGHTQIRLSILLTYMLGKSQLLMQLLRLLTHTSLKPILEPLAALLAPLATAASAVAATASWLAQPFVAAGRLLHVLLLGPLGRLAWLLAQLVWQLLALLLWSGPVQLLAAIGQALAAVGQGLLLPLRSLLLPLAGCWRSGLAAVKATGQVARGAASAVPAVARSGKAGAAVLKSSASAAASSSAWLWSPLEALEVLRVSTLRVVKSLQAVLRFFVALGSTVNQHRLSLGLTLRSKVRGGLRAAAGSPAGRVASAVAVRMGQEQRLARLQQRLARQDSGLGLSGAGSGLLLGGRGGGGGSLTGSLATGGGAAGEGEGEGEGDGNGDCSLVSSMDGGGGSAAAAAGAGGGGTAAGARRRSRGIGRARLAQDEEDGEAEVMSPLSAGLLSADEDEDADEEEEDRAGVSISSSRCAAAVAGPSPPLQLFASAAGLRHRAAGHGSGSADPAWADEQQQPGSFDAAGPGAGWRPASSSSSRHMSASPPLLLHLQQRQAAAQAAQLLGRGSAGSRAAAAGGGSGSGDPLLRHSVDAAAWLRNRGSASLGRHGRGSVGQWGAGGFSGRLQDDDCDGDVEGPVWADPSAAFASAPEQVKSLPLWPLPCGAAGAAGFDAWQQQQQQQQQLILFQQQQLQGIPGGAGQSGWSSSAGLLMLPARRAPQPATASH